MSEQGEPGALLLLLEQVQTDLKETNRATAAANVALSEQNDKLTNVELKLPNFASRAQVWATWIALALVIVLAILVGVIRSTDQRNETKRRNDAVRVNSCVIRGVLELAQSTSARNPIPPGLSPDLTALVEQSRAQATAFYAQALASVNASLDMVKGKPCPTPTPQPGPS